MSWNSVNKLETIVKPLAMDYIGLSAIDVLGLDSFVQNERNPMMRAVKRGFLWYLVLEGEEEVLTGHSNFRDMNTKVLIDKTFYDSVCAYIAENYSLADVVDRTVNNVMPKGTMVDPDMLSTAIILTGTKMLAEQLGGDHPVLNISRFFGF